jgi:hypothetical protein
MLPSGARTFIFLQYLAASIDGGTSSKFQRIPARCGAARHISVL